MFDCEVKFLLDTKLIDLKITIILKCSVFVAAVTKLFITIYLKTNRTVFVFEIRADIVFISIERSD
jgi:hypothetical protein